jgi:beta-phosphoglucomutase
MPVTGYHRCGVIFDMDGVLADTAHPHYESWQVVAERWGVEISWEDFERTFGRPNHQIIPELLGRRAGPEEIRQIDRLKEAAFRDILRRELQPVPGAVGLIEELHAAGFRLAVGSSGPRENIELVLDALGVADRFGAVISGWDVERGKPHPEVFLKAARGIGVEPGRCLVIEDVPAGVEAAHAAGMKCLAVTTTHPAESLRGADVVRKDLSDVTASEVGALIGVA